MAGKGLRSRLTKATSAVKRSEKPDASTDDELDDAVDPAPQAQPVAAVTDPEALASDTSLDDELDAVPYDESDEFPVLQQVLRRYFLDLGPAWRGRDGAFIKRYHKLGEDDIEFEGLADEIKEAIRFPKRATPMLNATLNLDLTVEQVRRHMQDLHNQMLERGQYSAEAKQAAKQAKKDAEPTAQEVSGAYWFRRINPIPGRRDVFFPAWYALAFFVGLMILGVVLKTYVPFPSWLEWVPAPMMGVGLVGMGVTAFGMRGMRDEVVHPEREQDRAKAKERAAKRRADQEERRERLRNIFS